jgi:hypothetical protein
VYDAVFDPRWRIAEGREGVAEVPRGDYRRYGSAPSRGLGAAELGRALRRHLAALLPEYMVPSAIMVVESWPLTPSGKLDRKALPESDEAGLLPLGGCAAPRSPAEEKMAAIWAEVLQRPEVGIHDNFFDLGGHSLLALRLFSLIRERFQTDLPLSSLFLRPTAAGLAELVTPPPAPSPARPSPGPMWAGWARSPRRFLESIVRLLASIKVF